MIDGDKRLLERVVSFGVDWEVGLCTAALLHQKKKEMISMPWLGLTSFPNFQVAVFHGAFADIHCGNNIP